MHYKLFSTEKGILATTFKSGQFTKSCEIACITLFMTRFFLTLSHCIWRFCYETKHCLIKGWKINEEQKETFLDCQMCERNACHFRGCSNLSASYIFCKNISDRFQGKTTSTLMSNHSTSDVILASRSTTLKSGNYILL